MLAIKQQQCVGSKRWISISMGRQTLTCYELDRSVGDIIGGLEENSKPESDYLANELRAHSSLFKTYKVSTGKNGVGQSSGSFQTPAGWHYVRARIGEGKALGTVFAGRRPTGEILTRAIYKEQPDRDWILTRILWLSGLEKGFNRLGKVDTMRRYIYIHGTPDEEPMGVPMSHGCIRMTNQDVVECFDFAKVGCPVYIESN